MLRPLARLPARNLPLSILPRAPCLSSLHLQRPLQATISRRTYLTQIINYDTPRIIMECMHDGIGIPYLLWTMPGIPYLWTIPLAALLVRTALYYPVTLYSRKALQRRTALSPLISAQKGLKLQEARTNVMSGLTTRTVPSEHKFLMKTLINDLQTRFMCGRLRTMWPIVQLPVFLWLSSNLRDMLGMPGSIVRTFLGRGNDGEQVGELFQQSMTEEGPSWALDLTAADPTGSLPIIVSVVMMSQTLISAPKYQRGAGILQRTPTILLVVLSGSIPIIFASAPAGILWYWAWSSGMALVTNVYLNRRYPLTNVKPCKRPVINT